MFYVYLVLISVAFICLLGWAGFAFSRWAEKESRKNEIYLKPDSRRNLQKAILRSGFGRKRG
jgi:hypothetical protein